MANHDNAPYIAEAIRSVQAQSIPDWELVIVDDDSSDDSIDVIEPFLDDPRIQLVRHDRNRGYIGTLMTAIATARADILGILDSDDALAPQALASMLTAYDACPEASGAYSQFVYCDAELHPVRPGYSRAIPVGLSNLHLNCASAFRTFRKSAYLRTPGFDESLLFADDKDLLYKLEEQGRG